jgi:hypothetical protein
LLQVLPLTVVLVQKMELLVVGQFHVVHGGVGLKIPVRRRLEEKMETASSGLVTFPPDGL